MKAITSTRIGFVLFAITFVGILLVAGCFSSSVSNYSAIAQTNQTNTSLKEKTSGFESLKNITEPCRYNALDFTVNQTKNNNDSELYELIRAGFPKEVSLSEAVDIFNEFTQCDEDGKIQPLLTSDEVVAAIRDWDCQEEKDSADKKVCADVWKIAETGKMPKGSFFDFDGGMGRTSYARGKKGYDVKTWEIYLYIWLDKYRRDMKDEPIYSRLIRLNYLSSKSAKNAR